LGFTAFSQEFDRRHTIPRAATAETDNLCFIDPQSEIRYSHIHVPFPPHLSENHGRRTRLPDDSPRMEKVSDDQYRR
jgi:hypothetical protein